VDVWPSPGLVHYIYIFSGTFAPDGILPGAHITASKSWVLLSWQHYCIALDHWASAKLCGVVQGIELRNFHRLCHLYSPGRPSCWDTADILVLIYNEKFYIRSGPWTHISAVIDKKEHDPSQFMDEKWSHWLAYERVYCHRHHREAGAWWSLQITSACQSCTCLQVIYRQILEGSKSASSTHSSDFLGQVHGCVQSFGKGKLLHCHPSGFKAATSWVHLELVFVCRWLVALSTFTTKTSFIVISSPTTFLWELAATVTRFVSMQDTFAY